MQFGYRATVTEVLNPESGEVMPEWVNVTIERPAVTEEDGQNG